MSKKLIFNEEARVIDKEMITRGELIITNPHTGKVVFKGSNKIILPGSTFTARKHFPNLNISHTTPSYNTAMGLDGIEEVSNAPGVEHVFLFSVGTDGCGTDRHQVFNVNPNKWCKPESLIPFRYVNPSQDPTIDRELYFGRKDLTTTKNKVAYYFKKFNPDVQYFQRYVKDKLPIENTIYESDRLDEIETFIQLSMNITVDECKEFFESTVGIEHAHINTLSLLCAVETTNEAGIKYYQNIRPITKVNFPNEGIDEFNKGLDIIYQLYY